MTKFFTSILELMRLQSEMNRIFEALEAIQSDETSSEIQHSPLYDVFETPNNLVIEIDLPGVDPQSLKITAVGNNLFLEGNRKQNKNKKCSYHLIERQRGEFRKKISIEGSFNTHKGNAMFKKGVLRIEFPKVKDRRGTPHQIEILSEEK
jgi:HSP20 family protein